MTITRDLYAARNRDFAPTLELDYSGAPLSLVGAMISMQVRLYARALGPPLAEHLAVDFTDSAHESDGSLRTLSVFPVIAREVLEALPTGLVQPEVGQADQYAYEIKLTYADSPQDALWIGAFILEPGVDNT